MTITSKLPEESEGLEAWGDKQFVVGLTYGVNDEAARLVAGFEPTIYELEVLAKHYVEEANDIELFWRIYEQGGSEQTRKVNFAYERLRTLESVLGSERFNAAIGPVVDKWNKEFAEAEEEEKALAPCSKCGGKRRLVDKYQGGCSACHC